jgi:type III secretion system YscQ/HrcQ family protein
MIVVPFELATFPRVSAREAAAARVWLRSLGAWPERWRAGVPALGTVEVTLGGVSRSAGGDRLAFAATAGMGAGALTGGVLSLDAAWGGRLVDAALGGPAALGSPRTLGPAERGVLAGLLAAIFEPLAVVVGLGPPPAGVKRDGPAIAFTVEAPAGAGVVRLELDGPPRAAAVDAERLRRQASRLPVVVRVELAATRLRGGEVAALGPGDAVVFDETAVGAFAAAVPWPGALAVGARGGGHAAPIQIDVEGAVTLTSGFRAARREIDMEPTESTDATAVLAAAPIEVVAELGRITLRGDELLGLAPGAVLTLPGGRGAVALRVGGELWAEGEIVDVDGELGVRVLRTVVR